MLSVINVRRASLVENFREFGNEMWQWSNVVNAQVLQVSERDAIVGDPSPCSLILVALSPRGQGCFEGGRNDAI